MLWGGGCEGGRGQRLGICTRRCRGQPVKSERQLKFGPPTLTPHAGIHATWSGKGARDCQRRSGLDDGGGQTRGANTVLPSAIHPSASERPRALVFRADPPTLLSIFSASLFATTGAGQINDIIRSAGEHATSGLTIDGGWMTKNAHVGYPSI